LNLFRSLIQNSDFRIHIAPLIISLTLLFSVVIIAITPPATGYELSIYEAYPVLVWILISINIFFSIYTILRSCDSQSKNLYYGYFSLLLIETIVFFLPVIRGYYSISRGAGDIYYHLFVASQIVNSGYLPLSDTYPVMHIWLSILHNFLPDFIILNFILSLVFFILYVLSLYLLGKTLLGTKNGGVFVSIFGIPLIFSYGHYALYPFLFALFFIPLILYAYQKLSHDPGQKSAFYICLIVLTLFIVFCHPMPTVFLMITFSIFVFFELVKRRKTLSRLSNIVAINIVTIVFVTYLFWLIHFRDLLMTLISIESVLLGSEAKTSILEYQANYIIISNAPIWLIIDRFIKIYGPIFLYFSISLFFLIYIIYQYYQNKKIYEDDLIYSLHFCVAICIGIALLIGYFIIFEPIRAAMYGIIFATILCGLFFYRIRFSAPSEKRPQVLNASITIIITIVCILTIITFYSSPWIGEYNSLMTFGEKSGNDWILEYRNAEIPIVKEELSNNQYAKYYFETTKSRNSQNLMEYPLIIPSQFGYTTNRTIGESFSYLPDNEVYMITTEMMKLAPYALPVDRRNLLKSFTDTDSIRLKNDPTVNSVYAGNKFGVWHVAIP
jgi:hypothetical protein